MIVSNSKTTPFKVNKDKNCMEIYLKCAKLSISKVIYGVDFHCSLTSYISEPNHMD